MSVIPEKLRSLITKMLKGYSRKNLQFNADELSKLLRKRTRTMYHNSNLFFSFFLISKRLPSDPFVGETKSYIPVAYNLEETFAYVVHRMPGIFGCNERVFSEISKRFPKFKPTSLLDFGSGLFFNFHFFFLIIF